MRSSSSNGGYEDNSGPLRSRRATRPSELRRPRNLSWVLLICTLSFAQCSAGTDPPQEDRPDPEALRSTGSAAPGSSQRHVHSSSLPGSWYPKDPRELRSLLKGYLDRSGPPPSIRPDQLVALIVPHAGYPYSGPTAAAGYRILGERKPRRVILLGPSHSQAFRGVCLSRFDFFETPLGAVPVDSDGTSKLRRCPLVRVDDEPHRYEHSVDIQLPFLQEVLGDFPFTVLPVLVGSLEEEDYPLLAASLRELLDDGTVLVISSDFTHYGPRYGYMPFQQDERIAERLRSLDDGACKAILQLDRKGFLAYQSKTGITVCGYQPIALLLDLLPQNSQGHLVSYTTSGQVTGDFENSVSYACLAFLRGSPAETHPGGSEPRQPEAMKEEKQPGQERAKEGSSLSASEKATLLRLARETLESYVRLGKTPDPLSGSFQITPNLKAQRGAFVTLKLHGVLRGCIGYIQLQEPLYAVVQENTINAASRDSRFAPVQADELSSIEIEISVLTQPKPVASYKDILLGVHGIILRKGSGQAVFLPQVAPEQGWDLTETLRHLSLKAGLARDAWKHPDATFSVFTAEVFEES